MFVIRSTVPNMCNSWHTAIPFNNQISDSANIHIHFFSHSLHFFQSLTSNILIVFHKLPRNFQIGNRNTTERVPTLSNRIPTLRKCSLSLFPFRPDLSRQCGNTSNSSNGEKKKTIHLARSSDKWQSPTQVIKLPQGSESDGIRLS